MLVLDSGDGGEDDVQVDEDEDNIEENGKEESVRDTTSYYC